MDSFEKKNPLDYAWKYGETKNIYRNPATPYIILVTPDPAKELARTLAAKYGWKYPEHPERANDPGHPRNHVFQVGYEERNPDDPTDVYWQWIATTKQLAMAIKVVKELQATDDDMGEVCAWSFP